jgi:hypothetical protein
MVPVVEDHSKVSGPAHTVETAKRATIATALDHAFALALFIVTYSHCDLPNWQGHVIAREGYSS